ncbi:VOC family protein [Patescibacteria group bacterium]|nr:VOC family protein [Patescibacteria group bacterium]
MDSVVHFELPFEDAAKIKAFYGNVFGWHMLQIDPGYYMATTAASDERGLPKEPGAINGGFKKRIDAEETPVIVIRVASVEDAVQKATDAGGKIILPRQTIGEWGIYARITDPEGNLVGLWEEKKK